MPMAMRTHYETLGVGPTASADQIRSAYRKLVLVHHPDRSSDPRAKDRFIAITEAYEVLSDPVLRRGYDADLQGARQREEDRRRAEAATAAKAAVRTKPRDTTPVAAEVARLSLLFSKGHIFDAEKLAREIIAREPKQPIPYAVLADVYRSRGNLSEAARYYSLALQMDPKNGTYLKRYEDLMQRTQVKVDSRGRSLIAPLETQLYAFAAACGMVLLAGVYLALSHETRPFGQLEPISTWTLGLMGMLFLAGISVGAGLAVANVLDRLDAVTSTTTGRRAPTIMLGLVAIVSFPAAIGLYLLVGLARRAFNYSTTRLILAVSVATGMLALAGWPTGIDPIQTLLWGGNLCYIASLIGWIVADSLRP